jgi:hypothetical protein
MLSSRISVVFVLALALAVCCVPAMAQIPSLDITQMTLNGSAGQLGDQQVLRLTQDGQGGLAGSGWYNTQQSVANGFTTVFQFQITHSGQPADGLTFVIQNAHNFEGSRLALGGTGGDIGYGSTGDEPSIDNSLAIEFDTYQNGWDPNANHIAVQSCGTGNNTPDHTATCNSGQPANLGIAPMPGVNLADGNVHTVILQYDPGTGDNLGTLSIFIDNASIPALTVPVQIDALLNLNEGGTAYVGFTGGTGSLTENGDILSWTFTPGGTGTPTTITQFLTPGPGPNFTNFVFGSYNHKYEYSNANAGDQVSVTATPSDPTTLSANLASFYPTTSCIVYDGTGGECVLFQVSCTETTGSDCTNLPYTLFESFNTNQNISVPCLLKSETYPPGVWTNILTNFTQSRFDPTGSGGTKGFSYFVMAQNCGPVLQASGLTGNNCNGAYTGTFRGNLTVSPGQSCTFTNGGVTGNLTQTGGTVLLQNNSFVNGNLQTSGGNLSLSNSTVGRNLQIQGGGTFSIGPAVTIGGNLQIQNVPAGSFPAQVCGASIRGNLILQNNGTATQIGSAGCPGNTVGGNLLVQNNSGATTVDSNIVGGNLNDQSNTGASQVFTNVINRNLQCSGNSAITGGGNTAHSKQGQCASF